MVSIFERSTARVGFGAAAPNDNAAVNANKRHEINCSPIAILRHQPWIDDRRGASAGWTCGDGAWHEEAMARIHIVGASGSGTSTLGAALAARLGIPHVDADSLFWLPTDPPFTTRRPANDRLEPLRNSLPVRGAWVFSGSALKWAASVEPFYDLVVVLHVDAAVRMERLRRREVAMHGARIEPGGDMAVASRAFLEWAAAYDTAGPEQRSLAAHEAWLASQTAPVLRLDSSAPVRDLVDGVLAGLERTRRSKKPSPA
jgi:hypothetical protein